MSIKKNNKTEPVSEVKKQKLKRVKSTDNLEKFKNIGERIKILRSEIGLTQTQIEEECNIPGLTLHRIEFGIGGTIPNFIAILQFFEERGYNLEWILSTDNKNLFKQKEINLSIEYEKDKVVNSVEKIYHEVDKLKAILKKME